MHLSSRATAAAAPQIYRMAAWRRERRARHLRGELQHQHLPLSPDGRLARLRHRASAGPSSCRPCSISRPRAHGRHSLTDTTADESPSFAPNGRLIIYATRQNGRRGTDDDHARRQDQGSPAGKGGDIREPDWGPFQRNELFREIISGMKQADFSWRLALAAATGRLLPASKLDDVPGRVDNSAAAVPRRPGAAARRPQTQRARRWHADSAPAPTRPGATSRASSTSTTTAMSSRPEFQPLDRGARAAS